jgi:SpoVK/Ycf46/Vps4 family AAA+-type ATPase
MKQAERFKTLKCIGTVYENARSSNLDPEFFSKVKKELQHLSTYFHVSQKQAFIIAMVFALNYKGQTVDLRDLINHIDCNPMKLLEYSDDFECLFNKGFFTKEKSRHGLKIALYSDQLQINEEISVAILKNNSCPNVLKKEKFKDVYEILAKLYSLSQERKEKELPTFRIWVEAIDIISSNLRFPMIKKINDFQFHISETYIFYYLIWRTLTGHESYDMGRMCEDIYDKPIAGIKLSQEIISGEHVLIKNKLIEIREAYYFGDTELKLTDASIKMLEDEGIKLFSNKSSKRENIIESSKIQVKQLYFSDADSNKLDVLKSLLSDNNLKSIQERLREKSMPIGVTALLHGAPGTGKTESVYQIARENQRDIFKVDISETKSAWFGESEKRIKAIFTEYKSLVKICERIPILLFNEADAIISKRKEIFFSSVAQTENAMQNILLDELENFEGIFIATTNLIKNLDSAFDRRFLFKIEFSNPDVTTKARIWKLKMPDLSEDDCLALASRFNFSGGQIDNIARKYEIHGLLNGVKMNFQEIINYCNTEILVKSNTVKIGYKTA